MKGNTTLLYYGIPYFTRYHVRQSTKPNGKKKHFQLLEIHKNHSLEEY